MAATRVVESAEQTAGRWELSMAGQTAVQMDSMKAVEMDDSSVGQRVASKESD